MTRPPNIVLVFVDNQPATMLGCAGNTEIHTPRLDGFARGAERFTRAYSPNAMCSPCRASMLTGLMPSQHGVHTWLDDHQMGDWPAGWNALAEFETLPERLAAAGYDTALIGKYHLGDTARPQNGFRRWLTMEAGHVTSFHDTKIIDQDRRYVAPEHSVDFFTRGAVDYIREARAADKPFFLLLTYPAPYGHWPSVQGVPDNRFADQVADLPMASVPREGLSEGLIDWILKRRERMPGEEDGFYKSLAQLPNDLPTLRNYYSQMSMVDDGVGQVLDALDDSGIAGETAVLYSADHGMSLGTHGFWGHGEDTWPSNAHGEAYNVPLLMRVPGRTQAARVVDTPVSTIDLFATVLDIAGCAAGPGTASRSLIDRAEGDAAVFMEQEETRAIRTADFLYMKRCPAVDDPAFRNSFFDLRSDPEERHDRIDDPACAEAIADLDRRLIAHFAALADPAWDLWSGGQVKGNSTRPFVWRDTWGPDWAPRLPQPSA
ncbi:sulfatase-like hydrolase/transferase [Ferrimonas balearica]|nr:sulfatase-like hydrolase/transferase [Ferrimonas balearica]